MPFLLLDFDCPNPELFTLAPGWVMSGLRLSSTTYTLSWNKYIYAHKSSSHLRMKSASLHVGSIPDFGNFLKQFLQLQSKAALDVC